MKNRLKKPDIIKDRRKNTELRNRITKHLEDIYERNKEDLGADRVEAMIILQRLFFEFRKILKVPQEYEQTADYMVYHFRTSSRSPKKADHQ